MLHIPLVQHRIWVGDKEIPDEQQGWIMRWKELHPHWEHRLWRDDDIIPLVEQVGLKWVWDEAPHASYKSDIGRFSILWNEGGIYMDTDYEPLRCLDELLHGCFAFVSWEARNGRLGCHVCGGMVGVTPHHPFTRQLIDEIPIQHQRSDVPVHRNNLGPAMVDLVVKKRLDVRVLEKHILIGPWSYATKDDIPRDCRDSDLARSSYAVHHYAASWVRK